ncbi:MAG: hypothetical protein AAGG46_09495 [Planctomycetota bacterium]
METINMAKTISRGSLLFATLMLGAVVLPASNVDAADPPTAEPAAETADETANDAAELTLPEGLKCFMMTKRDVKEDYAVDYKGAKVFVCCKYCVKRMGKQAERYEAQANHQVVLTGQYVQTKCPLTGEAITAQSPTLKIEGVDVFFAEAAQQTQIKGLEVKEQIATVFGKEGFKTGGFQLVKKPASGKAEEQNEAA